jgi:putative ubiquitin-RnfH superfamily antitoxin RatB of RatAB toxin-antitoxin module
MLWGSVQCRFTVNGSDCHIEWLIIAMSSDKKIQVETAFALPERQAIVELEVTEGTTAIEAVRQSNIAARFEGVDVEDARLGIFGKVVTRDQVLKAGDRVEIYRPLVADPKEIRKARAEKAKERRAAASD